MATLFRGTCQYIVEVCYRALNLQMRTLFTVGPHYKMTLSVFGGTLLVRKLKLNPEGDQS